MDADVAVVGAGLAGLAAAHELTSRGKRVALVDQESAQFDRLDDEDVWAVQWARAYVEFAAGEMRPWLQSHGIKLLPTVPQSRGALTNQLEGLPHLGVLPAPLEQVLVGADLGHPPVVENDYPVGRPGRLQPVCDEDGGPAAGYLVHRRGHPRFRGEVEVGRRLVQ